MTVIGGGSMLMGMLPIKVARILRWNKEGCDRSPVSQKVLSVLLCFGGGVLLATAFVHMMPEVRDNLNIVYAGSEVYDKVPWPEILVCGGLFLVYFVEELAHHLLYSKTHNPQDHHMHEHHDAQEHQEVCNPQTQQGNCNSSNWLDGDIRRKGVDSLREHTKHSSYGSTEGSSASGSTANERSAQDGNVTPAVPLLTQQSDHVLAVVSARLRHHHDHEEVRKDASDTLTTEMAASRLRSLLALLALSVHALLEGMAVGLQRTSLDVWYLCAAVATHKLVISFCIGMELVTSGATLLFHAAYVAVFALMSPAGVAIGIGLTANDTDLDSPVVAILQGLAAGTLLYVTFFEVLQRERTKCHAGLLQFAAVLTGFVVMVITEAIGGHEHSNIGHMEFPANVTENT